MAEAREVMDRRQAALAARDLKAVADCYAEDARALTPDEGELIGRDQILRYIQVTADAFPDIRYESLRKHESGNVAINEGFWIGSNSAPLQVPSGQTVAAGKQLNLRVCEVAIVEGGKIIRLDSYFDQVEFLGQLGLLPDLTA